MTSSVKENYIKAIYYLHQQDEKISLSELGKVLDVSKPTANDMVKKLKLEGLVVAEKYKPIKITELGKQRAAAIIRKHRLSEMFLSEIMKFGWEEVHEIAEELEHIRTDKFFDRMDELLGFPTTDPHGSPIPDKSGNFNRPEYTRLSQIKEGAKVVVKALRDSSSELLLYLNRLSIQLNTELKIESIEKFDSSYTVSYNNRNNIVLGKSVCDKLLVEQIID